VAQALPTYIMSVINIPLLLCDSLTSIIRDFWWVVVKGNRKTAWVAWRDLTEENFTVDMVLEICGFLTKLCWHVDQAWRLIDHPDR